MTDPSLDPRYPRAFQRGGGDVPLSEGATEEATAAVAAAGQPGRAGQAGQTRIAGMTRSSAAPSTTGPPMTPTTPEVDPALLVTGVAPARVGRAPLEVVVVGNPWMRALWLVGALALLAGIALTVAAEFAFAALQSATTYDPAAFLPARLMQVLGLPLIIAGTLGLVAATVLRLVAWRPAAVREVDAG